MGQPIESVLAGGGEMGKLMRSIDWSKTAVGPVDHWPQSLRTALSILLENAFPMYIAWGREFTQFYNDGYRPILGSTKHPAAMGISTRQTFAEIWNIIGPMFEGVMRGTPVFDKDFLLPLDRNGFVEECYFIFSYSPIRQESGDVGGVLVTVTETTESVLGTRRIQTLQELAAQTQKASTRSSACEVAATVLAGNPLDLPFALLYEISPDGLAPHLAGVSGAAPRNPSPDRGPEVLGDWQLADSVRTLEPRIVDVAWPAGVALPENAAQKAFVIPVLTPGGQKPRAVLVAGLSPRLAFDSKYRSFLELVAGHVGSAIASAEALEEAQARARALAEIDRAKTAFFSNVSHEFRTPLTLMLGPAADALASAESLSAEERERWALVHRNALRLSRLVNTLLDFARIEAGRVEASFEPTRLDELTSELASMFRSAIERAGLRLKLELEPLAEPAFIDREMWEKIVLNLLSNALKFTFEGSITVGLRLAGADFELTVRDTGVGIPTAELPLMFDRFHRIKGARARTHEGTGIGVALIAELVKLHRGRVTVESEENRGTTFRIWIPRGKEHLPPDRIAAPRSLPSTSHGASPFVEEALRWETSGSPGAEARETERPSATGSRERLLIADDNADMREYLTRLLGAQWEVIAVPDGRAALEAVRQSPPDLVVADVMMPGLDGFALLARLREEPRTRVIPVVLLSARAGEEAVAEGLSAGAADYLVKPFSARELLVRVASCLALARTHREARVIEQAAKERLYAHFMQTPFPVAILRGADHVLDLANQAALKVWGRDESIIGRRVRSVFPELSGQGFFEYLDEVFGTGVSHEGRATLARLARGPGGEMQDAFFDFVYAPLRDPTGAVEGVLVAGFEVTEQVRASQQLSGLLAKSEASERLFRDLVENIPELAWTARPDGYIDFYNRRWFEFTGTTFEQMQGWGWKSVHDPAYLEAVEQSWKRSIATGEPFEMEFPLRGADGAYRWFLTRVQPLHDENGRIVRWFGSNIDIDERRRNDEFKEIVLGILGHDLRTPLSTMLMTTQLLARRDGLSTEMSRKLERVLSSGSRMARMIDQLLDMTRARLAGGIPVKLTAQPLEPLVTKMVEESRAAHPEVQFNVRLEGACVLPLDADRMEQLLSNLLENAVTHGDMGRPITVTVTVRGQDARISIHNFGPPIDPTLAATLFNPFSRGQTQRGRSSGLGLGLYISERIVFAHGGRLTVSSSLSDGTRFEIALPLNRRAESPATAGPLSI